MLKRDRDVGSGYRVDVLIFFQRHGPVIVSHARR